MKGADLDAALAAWLQAAGLGDRAAFEQLYRHFQPRIKRFVLRGCARPHLADEVLNDVMWVVWKSAGSFRGESRVTTWVNGIAYRCLLKALRDREIKEEVNASAVPDVELAAVEPFFDDGPDRELRDWVTQALAALPLPQRLTVELAYWLGDTCEEIARIMSCPTGTVKARLMRAREKLKELLPALAQRPMSAS